MYLGVAWLLWEVGGGVAEMRGDVAEMRGDLGEIWGAMYLGVAWLQSHPALPLLLPLPLPLPLPPDQARKAYLGMQMLSVQAHGRCSGDMAEILGDIGRSRQVWAGLGEIRSASPGRHRGDVLPPLTLTH